MLGPSPLCALSNTQCFFPQPPWPYILPFTWQAEEPLYMRSGQLVKLLRSWQGTAPTIAGRFEELMVELYERLYVEYEVGEGLCMCVCCC